MEKKKRVCVYIYLLYGNAGLKLIIKSYFQFFLLILLFTIISSKNLGQGKISVLHTDVLLIVSFLLSQSKWFLI